MRARLAKAFEDYRAIFDRRVWLLTYGQVVLSTGRGILMPFSALYFYTVRGFPLTVVGLAFAIAFPLGSIVGLYWGALADRVGRKPLMVFGFTMFALTSALMPFVESIPEFFGVVIASSIGISAWSPASRAMVADVTPEGVRTRAYGLLYMANNLGVSFGLLFGAVLVLFLPYRALFFAEAVGAAAFLVIVLTLVQESHARGADSGESGLARVAMHFRGLSRPFHDAYFLLFLLAGVTAGLGWAQFYSTYSPFMKTTLRLADPWIGAIFAINTVMVVLLQIPLAGWAERRPRTRVFIVANYLLAWSLLGIWAAGRAEGEGAILALMATSVAIMTVGEIMAAPVGPALATALAPSSSHYGKYMAAFDLTWTVATGLGAVLGGAFFDSGRPMLLWPIATLAVVVAIVGYSLLERSLPARVNAPSASLRTDAVPALAVEATGK